MHLINLDCVINPVALGKAKTQWSFDHSEHTIGFKGQNFCFYGNWGKI